MSNGSSYEIKGSGMVSLQIHDGAVKKLGEAEYIPNFRRNIISLSRLDSSGYRWRVDDGILKVMHDSKIVMKEKKYREYYLLPGSSARGEL